MERQTSKITASNMFDEERVYEFLLVDAVTGLRIFHEYASIVLTALPQLTEIFAAGLGTAAKEVMTGDGPMFKLAQLAPKILPWPRVEALSKDLLVGAEIEGEKTDENGFCQLFRDEPLELYVALFWAVAANYPKYVDPLFEALEEEGGDDTTQGSTGDKKTSPEIPSKKTRSKGGK